MAVAPRIRKAGRVDIENREKKLNDELREFLWSNCYKEIKINKDSNLSKS